MSYSRVVKLLAIDDDQQNLSLLSVALQQQGLEILTADSSETAFNTLVTERPHLVLLDTSMPSGGMELLNRIVDVDPGVDVWVVASNYSNEAAVEAIQKGAADYLAKPLDIDAIRNRIAGLLDDAEVRRRTLNLDRELVHTCQFEGMVGRSPLMLEVFARIRRVAPHFRTVLITGATGTGKELVAQALHRLSPVGLATFVICNCSALVDDLAESELFGHVRGAFTGAIQDKVGLFEHADGGTIFLDEIGELSLPTQAKLLRVLQNREVQRVGSLNTRTINVRVIAATHRDLKGMVREGRFREDLYYRLAVVEIEQPALVDRREDLILLERFFIEKFSTEYKRSIAGLTRRAQTRLAAYPWPGNVRELENVIGHACMMADRPLLDLDDLPERCRAPVGRDRSLDERFLPLEEIQRRHVLRVLQSVGGNKARAAEVLGIGRATIYQILSKMKLEKANEATA